MKIFNGKITSNRRVEILNPFRMLGVIELQQVSSPATPTDANVIVLYNDAADNKVKVKKTGGTVVNLEEIGSGVWDNDGAETIQNKTIPVESNLIKHGTTNFTGDLLKYDGTRYNRMSKGSANQALVVNATGTDLEWSTIVGGGGEGEANTASNIGTAGIGLFMQKLAVDLQFKKLFSPTGTVLITDNVANERVDLDLGSGVVSTNQVNTYGDFQQTFRSSKFAITNPANTFAYFFVGSALAASRNITIPLLTANDVMVTEAFTQTLTNKTLTTGNTINVDQATIKHSTTNNLGELLKWNGSRYDRFARGSANSFLRVNAGGTDLEWAAAGQVGGVTLPDGTVAPSTGRWGAFWGGSLNGYGMLGMELLYDSISGETISSTESYTTVITDNVDDSYARFRTAMGFRRDSNMVFKVKWRTTHTSGWKVCIGLASTNEIPIGGSSDTPLNNIHGVVVRHATDIETNYMIARNNGASSQTQADSGKAAQNTNFHTAEFNVNSTNVVVVVDGTQFTYTTAIPTSTTAMSWFMHIENIGGTAHGLSVVYAQVVMS